VRSAILSGSHVVLDMSKTAYIGADAMGTLIHLLSVARRWKRELWLTGLHPFLLWVVRAAQLELSFRMAPAVAEALRRIEPEIAALPQFGDDWALCRIGGQWVPIHSHEMPELYRQVPLLLKQRVLVEPISVMSSGSHQEEGMISELVPVDAR